MTASDENGQKSGTVGTGTCIITMPCRHSLHHQAVFGQKQNGGCVPPPLLARPSPCDFFFGNHGWSRISKEGILLALHRFNKNRWQPLTSFLLKISDNVASSGSSTRITPSSHWGNTSETKVSNFYEYLNKFFVTIPEIFGSPLVYIHSMMLIHTTTYMYMIIFVVDVIIIIIIIIIVIIIIIYTASLIQREIFRTQLWLLIYMKCCKYGRKPCNQWTEKKVCNSTFAIQTENLFHVTSINETNN